MLLCESEVKQGYELKMHRPRTKRENQLMIAKKLKESSSTKYYHDYHHIEIVTKAQHEGQT